VILAGCVVSLPDPGQQEDLVIEPGCISGYPREPLSTISLYLWILLGTFVAGRLL